MLDINIFLTGNVLISVSYFRNKLGGGNQTCSGSTVYVKNNKGQNKRQFDLYAYIMIYLKNKSFITLMKLAKFCTW